MLKYFTITLFLEETDWRIFDTSISSLEEDFQTDSHSYFFYLSSHPQDIKNAITYYQFLRLRRLCSEESDFSLKSEEMCHFFDKHSYPASVLQASHHLVPSADVSWHVTQRSPQRNGCSQPNNIPFMK